MILFYVFWLNQMPNKNSISDTLSPRAIVIGSQVDFKTHCRLPFEAYVQTREENEPTNDISFSRTQCAISLGPSGNLQGGYKFLSLQSGKKITHRAFNEVPMPESIIKTVHLLADRNKQPESLEFADRQVQVVSDDNIFDDVVPPLDPNVTGVNENITNNTIENDPFADNNSISNDEAQNAVEFEHRIAETAMIEDNTKETPGVHENHESDEIPGVQENLESDEMPGVIDMVKTPGVDITAIDIKTNDEATSQTDMTEPQEKLAEDGPPQDEEQDETVSNVDVEDDETVISEVYQDEDHC